MEDLIKQIYQHIAPLGELCDDEFAKCQIENLVLREACKQALYDIEIQGASNTKEKNDEE